jgi:hypothetical protein
VKKSVGGCEKKFSVVLLQGLSNNNNGPTIIMAQQSKIIPIKLGNYFCCPTFFGAHPAKLQKYPLFVI